MTREWSGCERRRCRRPPSQIPTPGAGVIARRFPRLRICLSVAGSHPMTRRAEVPLHHHPSRARFRGWRKAGDARFQHGRGACRSSVAAGNALPVPQRPCPWSDGQMGYRGLPADRESWSCKGLASKGRRKRSAPPTEVTGSASGRSTRFVTISLPVHRARPPSCELQLHGERRGRHGAAWRTSPRCCGRFLRCRAWCRRRRRGCR